MFQANQEKMMRFMVINQDYANNKEKHKKEFDTLGKEIQEIISAWQEKLCHTMEKGKYGTYSTKIADKFIEEAVKYFPYYHEIGIKFSKK